MTHYGSNTLKYTLQYFAPVYQLHNGIKTDILIKNRERLFWRNNTSCKISSPKGIFASKFKTKFNSSGTNMNLMKNSRKYKEMGINQNESFGQSWLQSMKDSEEKTQQLKWFVINFCCTSVLNHRKLWLLHILPFENHVYLPVFII